MFFFFSSFFFFFFFLFFFFHIILSFFFLEAHRLDVQWSWKGFKVFNARSAADRGLITSALSICLMVG